MYGCLFTVCGDVRMEHSTHAAVAEELKGVAYLVMGVHPVGGACTYGLVVITPLRFRFPILFPHELRRTRSAALSCNLHLGDHTLVGCRLVYHVHLLCG